MDTNIRGCGKSPEFFRYKDKMITKARRKGTMAAFAFSTPKTAKVIHKSSFEYSPFNTKAGNDNDDAAM